ncbi:MAG: hypothetical protein IH627_14955 [Rubrivivax sp.]|nr:hypothetical protein [Rubrivivax sp.]
MSDLSGTPGSAGRQSVDPFDPHTLMAQLGREVAGPLSSAAERVAALTATGRITRGELSALRDEIDSARRTAIMAQQASRLVPGRVAVRHVRLDLTALLRVAVRERAREIATQGIEVRQLLAPVEVRSDATLLSSLLRSVLGWSFEHACARIELTLDIASWPAQARLHCAFAYRLADDMAALEASPADRTDASLDTLSWLLLQQTAAVLGIGLGRRDAHGLTELTLEFPATLAPTLPALQGEAAEDTVPAALDIQSLAGHRVLAVVAQREMRSLMHQALRPLGVMLDFVATVDEARQFCEGGLPHALVYEATPASEPFERLRAELAAEAPRLAFICIVEHGRAFEVLSVGGRPLCCVGRDAIIDSLPAALAFELARTR